MVVVHRAHGFRFVIYTFDHEPSHVHVYGQGRAKVQLFGIDGFPLVIEAKGMKAPDVRRVLAEVEDRQLQFQEDWDRISESSA
jgi:hypothetical protein